MDAIRRKATNPIKSRPRNKSRLRRDRRGGGDGAPGGDGCRIQNPVKAKHTSSQTAHFEMPKDVCGWRDQGVTTE